MPKTFPLDLAVIYTASEAVSRTRGGLNPLLHEVSALQEPHRSRWLDQGL